MSHVLTAKDSIITRVPPTYQYSVLNGWGTNEQDDEEVPVLDLDYLDYLNYFDYPKKVNYSLSVNFKRC